MNLHGGNITIQMTGDGSKGIKCDGFVSVGKTEEEGPILNIDMSGERYNSSSSTKAIKALGSITINSGESVVVASKEKAEGLESKLRANPSIVFKGGKHYFKCNDDCISSAGGIHFDGGIVVCSGKANDAVDSNYGRVGAITIGDGTIFAYTAHKRNGGLDCDNKSFIQITGNGTAISCGGNTLGVSDTSDAIDSAVQGYFFRNDTIIYEKEKYYTLADASGNNLVTFSFENKTISFLSFFTAKGMRKDESYSVKYSQAAPTDATVEWHGLYLGSTATGQTPVTSFTAK